VYFAGDGIHKFGDYIIPVGAPSDLQKCTLDDLISVNEIISCIQTSKKPKLLTFLLDSCRTIPQWNAIPASYMHLHTYNNLIIGYATSENRGAYEVIHSSILHIYSVIYIFFSHAYSIGNPKGEWDVYDVLQGGNNKAKNLY